MFISAENDPMTNPPGSCRCIALCAILTPHRCCGSDAPPCRCTQTKLRRRAGERRAARVAMTPPIRLVAATILAAIDIIIFPQRCSPRRPNEHANAEQLWADHVSQLELHRSCGMQIPNSPCRSGAQRRTSSIELATSRNCRHNSASRPRRWRRGPALSGALHSPRINVHRTCAR